MLKRLVSMWCMLIAAAMGCCLYAQSVAGFTEGVIRVKLQPEVGARISNAIIPMDANGIVTTGVTQLDRVNQKVKAVRMTRVFPYSPKFEARHKAFGLDLWYEIHFDNTGIVPTEARNLYKAVPGIQIAECIRPMVLIGGNNFRTISASTMAKVQQAATQMPFDDPLLPQQWHYNNDGSIIGTVAGADANVFKGWTVEKGKSDVLVAIIDGGFQVDHPDLADNVWVNEAELNGKPGVDDDGNGYTDDIHGYNFVINSSDIGQHSHGTHVAGTVGAVNNNGIGVCGVAGGSGNGDGIRMMSCAVFDSRASQNVQADYAAALVYAADMGANIAQCSWGWATPDYKEEAVLEAVRYFTQNGGGDKMSGGLCIFANGNNGDQGNYYPACMPEVVAVASMTATGVPAYYSSCGTWCDVAAPGGLLDNGQKYGVLSTLPNGTYGFNEGTSMACPHVSGIAALILSKYGNSNFSNETLRTQLITSVNDLYARAPEGKGLYGSGYIDAYKALQIGSGEAPDAVSDMKLTASQDNILIEWTIPQAEEKTVDHHVIYYSTEPFTTAGDLSGVNKVNVDTKFMNSGDAMSYELGGLTPLTTYYIAMTAYNRWGDGSAMSAVQEATTNAGPTVSLDKTSLTLAIDAASASTATDSFTIDNTGAGMLKYSLTAATKSVQISTSSREDAPTPGLVVPMNGAMSIEKAAPRAAVVSPDYRKDDFPVTMTWSEGIAAYLGDQDMTKPNALAQYFYVDPQVYPEGFNLTALNFGGYNGNNPIVEIYDGSRAISVASLLREVKYQFWAYNYDLNLDEQMYFAPGSSFWVVAKFPEGQKNPLGSGYANTENTKQYCFFSNDNGQTWTQLSESLKGGNFESIADELVWDIRAISKNPDWSKVLNPDPQEGSVRPGEQQVITMTNNGQKLVNGTYNFNLHLNTNETPDSKKAVSVKMTVKGYKPELVSPQLVNFGDLLVGQSKILSVELVNNGYGAFAGKWGDIYSDGIKCSSDQFQMPSYMSGIAARSSSKMDVTFKPTKAGSFSGTVTITSGSGATHSFTVRGVAADPAKVAVDKTEIDFQDLTVGGDSKSETITITNEGQYPLEYVFPKFSDKTISGAENTHKFGYTYISNLNGASDFQYDGNPALNSETDITSQFDDSDWQSQAINIGFKFPFYGKDYEQLYVSSHGGVMFNTQDGNISCMIPVADCVQGLGYISAYANSGHLDFGANSKVSYGRQDGKFIVKFANVLTPALEGGDKKTIISFHMALCPDGSVELYYDDYDPTTVFTSGQGLFAGISDIDCNDVFVVTDNAQYWDYGSTLFQQIFSGTAIKIVAPAKSMIESLSSTDGVIGIGESKQITITAAAGDDLYAGALENNLTLLTNDPLTPGTNIKLKANIVGDLQPLMQLDAESIDFGSVFRTSKQMRSVLLSNNGRSDLKVTSVSVKGGKFTLADDLAQGFTVAPGQGKDLNVTLPTDNEGSVEDTLVITLSDNTTTEITLKGTIIGTPIFNLQPDAVSIVTGYQQSVNQNLTIENKGNEELSFNVVPEDWFDIADLTADDETSKIDYVFKAKSDGYEIPFEWIDITSDYDSHQPMSYYLDQTDYYTLELPFEFPFYGKKYNKMYVYNTGFVSFDEPETDYKQFPEPPGFIPTTDTFYRNIIAPFWGNHTMGAPSTDGSYIKSYDDHVVVSYMNYGNSAMMGMDFQVIIYKDGTFKFQYSLRPDGMMLGVYGLCGIQDTTGKRGVCPSDQYISSGNAMMWYPVKNMTLAPAATATIPVTIHAEELAGEYSKTIEFRTNDPQKEQFMLPVSLTINGEAVPVFPEELIIEQTVDPNYGPGEYEFTVENHGDRAFTINSVQSELFEMNFETWSQDAMLLVYAKQENGGGIDPGPLSLAATDENMQWMPVEGCLPITIGKEPVRFKIYLMNTYEIRQQDYDINFYTDLAEAPTIVVAKVNVTDMPQIGFDKEEIVINATAADYKIEESMQISNNGNYKLTYSLRLDPTGRDEEEEIPDGGGIAPGLMNVLAPAGNAAERLQLMERNAIVAEAPIANMPIDDNPYQYDYPKGEEFTNLLYYPMLKPWNSAKSAILGTGSAVTENFYAATRFVAPEEGFNLSKLYFVGTIGDLENVDIEASVIQGGDVTSNRVMTRGKLRVEKDTPAADGGYYGTPRMLTFDREVYINPADTFYVVMKYPAGYGHSALLASRDGVKVPGRCMAYLSSMGGWIDMEELLDQEYGYGPMGYFMTCVETQPGESWIKLLDTPTEGEVAVGESATVKFSIDASRAYFDKDNRATLVIKSNDPMSKLVNYHVTLNKNAAPVVTAPEGTISVSEGSSAIIPLTIADEEGDAFTVALGENNGEAVISSFTNAEGTQDGVTEADGVISVAAGKSLKLHVTVSADYETAGLHTLVVEAADELGNSNSASILYNVEHTNRAPEYIGVEEIDVTVGESSDVFEYATLFNDPDDDEMTYSVAASNTAIISVFDSATGFIIKGNKVATTTVRITATDALGAATTKSVSVNVKKADSIDDITTGNGGLLTDINGDNLSITLGKDVENASFMVCDAAGRILSRREATGMKAGETISLGLGEAPAGVYILSAVLDGQSIVMKVMK